MFKKLFIFGLVSILTACTITPKPLAIQDRYRLAKKSMSQLFSSLSQKTIVMDYYEALARSTKDNLDYRIKLVNIALESDQLDVATFTMFPAFNVSSTLYTRSNDYSVAGISANGVESPLSSSTPRTLLTSRQAISWNILDFGMGFVKAKQQSDRVLIAEEESRRQLQQLAQDVLVAYWVAYSAQQLLTETGEFQRILKNSKRMLERAVRDQTVPKENLLNYQAALLDGDRKLIQLQYKYDKAMLDLKHLLFIQPDQRIILLAPPAVLFQSYDLSNLNLAKMDAVTLVHHPQLQGQNYQQRIAKLGVQTVLLQALPGLTLNYGKNYDSNQFLLNNRWIDKSVDVAWNLLNLASLPANYKTAKAQIQYEHLKAMAMTMAALTETRYAYSHYQTVRQEYYLARKQSENAKALFKLNQDRKIASVASDQQVVLAKLKAIASKMDEDLLLSDLSVAIGQLYLSVGVDIIPKEIIAQPLPQAIETLKAQLGRTHNFASYIDETYYKLFQEEPVLPGSSTGYTIQLFATNSLESAKQKKNTMAYNESLAIGKTRHNHREMYVITYGKYKTRQEADLRARSLPDEFAAYAPWVRRTNSLTWTS